MNCYRKVTEFIVLINILKNPLHFKEYLHPKEHPNAVLI